MVAHEPLEQLAARGRPAGLGKRARAALARLSSPELVKRFLYSLYAQRLQARIALGPMPRHIGVILDGNRRYAQIAGLGDPTAGHLLGSKRIDDLLAWCDELEVPVITLWSLSIDNLGRDPRELESLIAIMEEKLPHLRDLQARARRPRRVRACGRLELLPDSLRQTVARVEQETERYGPFLLNIALGYGGREEIVDAVKRLLRQEGQDGRSAQEVADGVTTQAIARHLYLHDVPDPDLIIRTSGEQRLSGFLLWESVYSEYYFCDALWPAFRKIDLLRAIRSYQERRRRFGR